MTTLAVSIPHDRLLADVRSLLSPEELAMLDLTLWPMEEPTDRTHIDLVVTPYLAPIEPLQLLADVTTQLVQGQSIGYDNVPAALPPGHTFANAATVHESATAELALALTLASQRRIDEFVRNQQAANWRPRFSQSLADRRVTLLGYGGVGKAIAARLVPFEVQITAVASHARDDDGKPVRSVDDLMSILPTTEILIVSLPGGDATKHIINADVLAALPDGALVVNVGRGSLIDPEALFAETSSGRLRAALDVTEPEPLPSDSPLWSSPGVIISPHVGGAASAMQPRMAKLVARQIRHLLAGEPVENVVLNS